MRLFDAAQVATAVLDARGVLVGWSQAAERLLGYSSEELLDRPVTALLVMPMEWTASKCRRKEGWSGVVAVRHKDGRRLKVAVRVSPLLDPAGSRLWTVLAQEEQHTSSSELSQLMFEPLLAHSPIGVAVFDTDLRFVWVNDWLEYGGAVPRDRRLGKRLAEALPEVAHEQIEAQMRRVLQTGVPVLNYEFLGPRAADPDRTHAWWMCFFRLEDSAGRVLGVWYMTVDNTDRWRARERMDLLTEASARIGSTLDVARTAQELAEIGVPRFADVAIIDLLEPVLRGEDPPARVARDVPALRRVGMQSSPETTVELWDVLNRLPASLSARCLSDGTTWVGSLADFSASAWAAEDPARVVKAQTLGIRSILVAPVQARGICLGAATFLRSRRLGPFDEDDVILAEELVARAAVCIDNARRFTRERRAALTLQHSLLPRGLAGRTVLDVASRYLPANAPHAVGGDWFDVIPLSGARVALVVGDVVGHGTNAAVTMGRLRAAVRTLADLDLPPAELLAHLDDLVIGLVEQEEAATNTPQDEYRTAAMSVLGTTCLYAVYDPVTRRCTLARAGHPPPAIVGVDGTVSFPDLPAGPPLGLGLMPFESVELELADGTLLALYTNGLIEAGGRDVDAGLAQLADALARPSQTLETVCEHVTGALLVGPPRDDAALLLARTRGLEVGKVASWDLARDPAVVADARRLAVRRLADWGLEELQFSTELIVSELVTNAIRYGAEPIHLRLIWQDVLICEVADGSSTSPRLRHARTTDEGGRGLFLIAQLARRWGTRYTTTGKIIWVEQNVANASGSMTPLSPLV